MILPCTPVIDPARSVALCRQPYPGHPRGCPQWGACSVTPLRHILDLERPTWLAVGAYDLAAHAARQRARWPAWSEAQCRNPRHWQGTARATLRRELAAWLADHPGIIAVWGPESHGLDVTSTCTSVGVELEWPAVTVARQVVLLGHPAE